MPKTQSLMTRDVQTVHPKDTLQHAAQLMERLDIGALPVCDDGRVVGMVTDRDITVRATAKGLAASTAVDQVMSTDVVCCQEDDDVEQLQQTMCESQVRRVPIVGRDDNLVGIVSLGDLALRQSAAIDDVVREVSSPA